MRSSTQFKLGIITTFIGLGFFSFVIYAQNGGLVTDIKQDNTTVIVPTSLGLGGNTFQVSTNVAGSSNINLPEVLVEGTKQQVPQLKKSVQNSSKKIKQCIERELEQGVREETPTVMSCDWIVVP
jgi:predicted aldo/keto reductase-like oxidoreductase